MNWTVILAVVVILAGCGGGGGASSDSGPVTGAGSSQAILGPVSGAEVRAYRLSDRATPIEVTKAAEHGDDLQAAGRFSLALTGVADDEWILVEVRSGRDIDADDDGIVDPTPTPNSGPVFTLAAAEQWRDGVRVTALADAAWRLAEAVSGDPAVLAARLDLLARWLIAEDLDGDGDRDYADLLQFSPRDHQIQAAVDYQAFLPSGNPIAPGYIDHLHSGVASQTVVAWITGRFGSSPWIADTTANLPEFAAVNGADPDADIRSEAVAISGFNRPLLASVSGGLVSRNGGTFSDQPVRVHPGDRIQLQVRSSAQSGESVTALLSLGDLQVPFVVTTAGALNPDPFQLPAVTDAEPGSSISSDPVVVSGLEGSAPISVSGGSYSVNGGAPASGSGSVSNGDTVVVVVTAPDHPGESSSAVLTIGDSSESFEVSTVPYEAHSFLAGLGIEMALIPAAGETFVQGCFNSMLAENGSNDDPDCQEDERPEHVVSFDYNFAVSTHEVTFAAWDACVADGGCSHSPDDEGWGRGLRPVINVSASDIEGQFLPWLMSKTGRVFRLPTESEWEYVARGGTTTVYNWGDTLGSGHANCKDCGSRWDGVSTAPTGSFAPNAYGIFDIHGNVYEWTRDIYHASYEDAPLDGSARLTGSGAPSRVVRGGAWANDGKLARSANRSGSPPAFRLPNVGFRLVEEL